MSRIIELSVTDMLDDGRAFGRKDGCAVFVSGGCGDCAGAVPGDLVRVEILKEKKNSLEAALIEIVVPSPDRIKAECPYFAECGGCTLQELSYDAQLKLKRDQVKSKLERLGGLVNPKVTEVVAAETLKYYRNKATFAVGPHGEVGFMKGKSHFVMDIDDCMLQSDAAMVCADALRVFLKEHGAKNCGIGQMTVRTAFGTGEVMVVLEEAKASGGGRNKKSRGSKQNNKAGGRFEIPDIEVLIGMLDVAVYSLNAQDIDEEAPVQTDERSESFYSLESVALVYGADPKNDKPGKCVIAAGKPTITEEVMRSDGNILKYEISPQSFYQVNPEQMIKLYDKACEYAALNGGETVLDLYCGAGTIGIWLLDELRSRDEEAFGRTRVIGIESVKPAVIDANRNSVINGLVNTRYIAGRAEEELPGMMGLRKLYKWNEVNERVEREPMLKIGDKWKHGAADGIDVECDASNPEEMIIEKVDVVVLDPPRAGCAELLLDAAVQAAPDRIVYVSCDPGTLARDIRYLSARGYEFIEATPVDQFPWTSHIEVVAKIQKL